MLPHAAYFGHMQVPGYICTNGGLRRDRRHLSRAPAFVHSSGACAHMCQATCNALFYSKFFVRYLKPSRLTAWGLTFHLSIMLGIYQTQVLRWNLWPGVQTRQKDQPGVISAVSTVLAEAGVNISFMSVSVTPDNDAVMALGLDQEPTPELLAKLPSLKGITEFAMFSEKV